MPRRSDRKYHACAPNVQRWRILRPLHPTPGAHLQASGRRFLVTLTPPLCGCILPTRGLLIGQIIMYKSYRDGSLQRLRLLLRCVRKTSSRGEREGHELLLKGQCFDYHLHLQFISTSYTAACEFVSTSATFSSKWVSEKWSSTMSGAATFGRQVQISLNGLFDKYLGSWTYVCHVPLIVSWTSACSPCHSEGTGYFTTKSPCACAIAAC
jgi:hypothetical protein